MDFSQDAFKSLALFQSLYSCSATKSVTNWHILVLPHCRTIEFCSLLSDLSEDFTVTVLVNRWGCQKSVQKSDYLLVLAARRSKNKDRVSGGSYRLGWEIMFFFRQRWWGLSRSHQHLFQTPSAETPAIALCTIQVPLDQTSLMAHGHNHKQQWVLHLFPQHGLFGCILFAPNEDGCTLTGENSCYMTNPLLSNNKICLYLNI